MDRTEEPQTDHMNSNRPAVVTGGGKKRLQIAGPTKLWTHVLHNLYHHFLPSYGSALTTSGVSGIFASRSVFTKSGRNFYINEQGIQQHNSNIFRFDQMTILVMLV